MRTDRRSNSASARAVVSDLEFLQGHIGQVGDSANYKRGRGVRGVALVRVGLDDDTLVDLRAVCLLVFGLEVGVELNRTNRLAPALASITERPFDLPHDPYRC